MKKRVIETKVKINPSIIFTESEASIITLEMGVN